MIDKNSFVSKTNKNKISTDHLNVAKLFSLDQIDWVKQYNFTKHHINPFQCVWLSLLQPTKICAYILFHSFKNALQFKFKQKKNEQKSDLIECSFEERDRSLFFKFLIKCNWNASCSYQSVIMSMNQLSCLSQNISQKKR